MKIPVIILLVCIHTFHYSFAQACGLRCPHPMQQCVESYVAGLDADVGVAVISADSVMCALNADKTYPMLSVMKFPLAMAVTHIAGNENRRLEDGIWVFRQDIKQNTYSPMRDIYDISDSVMISLDRLLYYSVALSDNNAADILLRYVGGPAEVSSYMVELGFNDISVLWSEYDMHRDIGLSRGNVSTPMAMVRLLEKFDCGFSDSLSVGLKGIMEGCRTGLDRIPAPYIDSPAVVIGHKTGTSDKDPGTGRYIGVNDAGYVLLPDGRRYYIAVFVAESGYGLDRTSRIIGDVSARVAAHMGQ